LRHLSSTRRRRAPAPLFPYTTLFRSHRLRHLGADAAAGQEAVPALPQVVGGAFADPLGPEPAGDGGDDAGACVPAPEPVEGHPEDRKSTRLNSSHVKISYAVFCLKKK